MTAAELITMLLAAGAGFVAASLWIPIRLKDAPAELMRTNVNGRRVPAVLGGPLVLGGMTALAAVTLAGALGWEPGRVGPTGAALALVVVVMYAAGARDDRRGDESARGFRGHLAALAQGRVTGGALKIAAGAVAGAGAALLLVGPDDLPRAAATIVLVGAGANTVNLFDRAPGRAAKVVLVAALPLLALGNDAWGLGAAGVMGALIACMGVDLAEDAMLGDAGANPLGAVVGLGLAASLSGWGLWVAVAVVLFLNVASERWSFSRIIADTPWLDSFDRAGRK